MTETLVRLSCSSRVAITFFSGGLGERAGGGGGGGRGVSIEGGKYSVSFEGATVYEFSFLKVYEG